MRCTRRQWLSVVAAGAAWRPAPDAAWAQAAAPVVPYDLVIAGGRVIDPSQKLDAVADVAIANGRIVRVTPGVLPAEARRVFDARGRLVMPGLIDVHAHVYDRGIPVSIDPDRVGLPTGVTTIVDAGSAGASTFPGFRAHVIERASTRVYALLNISTIGLVVTNEIYLEPKLVDPQAAIRVIEQHRDLILGLKVRINGLAADLAHDTVVLGKARQAADATGLPLMVHWTHEPELLALLRAGDILTHPFNPPPHGQMLDGNGRILPQILALGERGIFTDFAHGNHLKWETAEAAAAQGWFPDTISTDLHMGHVAPRGIVFDLVTTMSKFLHLGMPLDKVVAAVTDGPRRMLRFPESIGSLQPGSVADVTVLDLVEQETPFVDTLRQTRTGRRRLVAVATFKSGRAV